MTDTAVSNIDNATQNTDTVALDPKLVIAMVEGKSIFDLPQDLYIPPEAMRVFLEIFEGPLDLLLYLIRKQNLDILNIPVAAITKQYVEYIEYM